jgi:hypothetical protein
MARDEGYYGDSNRDPRLWDDPRERDRDRYDGMWASNRGGSSGGGADTGTGGDTPTDPQPDRGTSTGTTTGTGTGTGTGGGADSATRTDSGINSTQGGQSGDRSNPTTHGGGVNG